MILNACRYDGAVLTVSTRALIVLYAIFGSLAQYGTNPHCRASRELLTVPHVHVNILISHGAYSKSNSRFARR
jgi:hypothetical protein